MVDSNTLDAAVKVAQEMSFQKGLELNRYIDLFTQLWGLGIIYIIIFAAEMYIVKWLITYQLKWEGWLAWGVAFVVTAIAVFPFTAGAAIPFIFGFFR